MSKIKLKTNTVNTKSELKNLKTPKNENCNSVKNLEKNLETNSVNFVRENTNLPDFSEFFDNLNAENRIVQEMITKFQSFPKVTFYGGASVKNDSKDYLEVQKLANSLSNQGFVVISGGGPGIMAAAIGGGNMGKTQTLGFRLNLVSEPPPFLATTDFLFTDFAPRKLALRNSEIMIFAPGGFGTLDELMEVLTLLKTGKMQKKQIFLYNSSFWSGLLKWICQKIMASEFAVEEFLQYFVVCDEISQILQMIGNTEEYNQKSVQNSCFIN